MANILVIDDESNIRTMIRMALRQGGHKVEEAADGPGGLLEFRDGRDWDLVLLDQRMPGMDGLEVLREIRSRDPLARVVMITAFGTIDLAVDAMKAGATDFLRKPFDLETLRGAVGSALGERPPEPEALGKGSTGTRYAFSTVNGYRIESLREPVERASGEIRHTLFVRAPNGNATPVVVVLQPHVVEQVLTEAGRDEMPEGGLFWQGFCEEALANYVWQNASVPIGGKLRVDVLTTSLRRWVQAVLAAQA